VNSQGGKKPKMKKLLKSKKALSPVIAAIILIAVTVAVSIAVAAWMGSLSMGFMETKELTINKMTFNTGSIQLNVTNTGTGDFTVTSVKVNGNTVDVADVTLIAGAPGNINIPYTVAAGTKYSVSVFASDGTLVGSYTDTAQTPIA
jgi:flagellin-like protein